MSTQAETILLPPRLRWRRVSLRLGDFPLIPSLILVSVGLVAIFANVLAPHNPEVGSLAARFRPPFWQTGGSTQYLEHRGARQAHVGGSEVPAERKGGHDQV